ncbi:MAG: metallopeptidase family protein [Verrucomicrobiia bacterium]
MIEEGDRLFGDRLTTAVTLIARRFILSLPSEIREAAEDVLIVTRLRPDSEEDDDLLGLFEGPTRGELAAGASEIPPRITLFAENLWQEADEDLETLEEEVEVTLFHEIGHYIGLDEEDLEARDLA